VIGVTYDLVAAMAFDMSNEANAAAVMLEFRLVEPRRFQAPARWIYRSFIHA
jgi:hypothetical protein